MKRLVQIATALLLTAAPAGAAVQIIDSNGILTGATGVDIGGTLYDVSFLDGTCISTQSGCNESTDFAFATLSSALLAGDALLNQVFTGFYDQNPASTAGCGPNTTDICVSLIYYFTGGFTQPGVERVIVGNFGLNSGFAGDPDNFFSNPDTFGGGDTSGSLSSTTAVFTLSPLITAVPEPSTWGMMLMGFGALGAALRRRKRAHHLMQTA